MADGFLGFKPNTLLLQGLLAKPTPGEAFWRQKLANQGSISRAKPSLAGQLENAAVGALRKAGVSDKRAARLGSKAFAAVNDLTPVGNATMAADAGQRFKAGHPLQGLGLSALAVLPGAAGKMGKGMFGGTRFYHGTASPFTEFSPDKIGKGTDAGKLGRGFYFSARPDIASSYAQLARPTGSEIAPNVVPAYLDLQNPVTFDAGDGGDLFGKLRDLNDQWGIPHDPVLAGNEPNPIWSELFTEHALKRGHDGAVLKFPDGGHEAVVFSPEQIRSIFAR